MGANRSLKQWWLVGVLLSLVVVWSSWSANAKSTIEPRAVSSRGGLTDDEQSTIRVFENNSPSVVFITTVERVLDVWTRNVSEVPSGTGSGFLWDEEGHIVTNNHVVEGHRTAKVRLSDQQTFDAVVVGTSPEHDLAVLKLQSVKDIPQPVQIGSSNDLKVGQKVLAIGNPFGLDHTLTSGIISALNRSIDGENGKGMEGLIQTDAAINPGNSGGPLLDSAGRLIGVNVAIYSPSGASAGIGFAIPVDTVNRVVPRLIKDGRYTRPVLGVTSEDSVSQRITEKLGTFGLLVLKVSSRSPAEQAGLRGTQITPNGELILGDIIQSIDGKEIRSVDDLSSVLDAYPANSTVRIHLLRDGKTAVDLTVELSLLR